MTEKRLTTRRIASVICNLTAAALTAAAWCIMNRDAARSGMFSAVGLRSLRYFTVDSNLLNAFVSLLFAGNMLNLLRGRRERISPLLQRFRLMAADAVGLTFLVVAVFLGPRANVLYHLLLPLLSVISFCLTDYETPLPKRACLFAALPVPVYGAGYILNLFTNNYTGLPSKNDWYGFGTWGVGPGLCLFAAVILIAAALARLLLFLAERARKRTVTERR